MVGTPKRATAKGFFGAVVVPPYLGGGYGLGKKRTKKGKKAFTAWNVEPNKALGFLKGPEYKKSYNMGVFRDLDKRTKKAQKGRKKKDPFSTFFNGF